MVIISHSFTRKKTNQIWPKIEIQKCENENRNNLLNYSNKYFLYNDDNYLYVYDFDKKQISNSFSFLNKNFYDIILTKNYLIINDIISIFIYNRKNFFHEQTKRAYFDYSFIEEIESGKIAVFRNQDILIFSKDKTFKFYFFMLLRIFIILVLLLSLFNSLYNDKFGLWYLIKNYLKYELLVYLLVNYKLTTNCMFISDFF